jgi:hypothetical protein
MQNLNPNSVLQIAVFIAQCEGYLGIRPNFALWKYYFCATVFVTTQKFPRNKNHNYNFFF